MADAERLRLVLVPKGEFLMGSPDDDPTGRMDEKPQHRVRLELEGVTPGSSPR